MRNRFVITPAGILAVASLLLNILVIGFGFNTHPIWFIALAFTVPLLWFSFAEMVRDEQSEKN